VPSTTIDMEDCLASAKPSPADTKLEAAPSNMFSGAKQLQARFTGEQSTLVVPFNLESAARGIARLRLGTDSESGTWSVALDGQPLVSTVDLYSPALAVREVRLGMLDLKAGNHNLTFGCKGRNGNSSAYFLGIDALVIDGITPYAVPAAAK